MSSKRSFSSIPKGITPPPKLLSLRDQENNEVTFEIDQTGYGDGFVTWRSVKKDFSPPGNDPELFDIEMKNINIGHIAALRISISIKKDEHIDKTEIELLLEEQDKRTILDNYGDDLYLTISGPREQRRLNARFEIGSRENSFYRTASCSVEDDITKEDIEFMRILSGPQDMPHGVLLKIKGQEREVVSRESRSDDDDETNWLAHYWAEIAHELDEDNDLSTALECLENIRLIKLLRGKDVLELTKELKYNVEELKKSKDTLSDVEKVEKEQKKNIQELKEELKRITEERDLLLAEKATYKHSLLAKVKKALESD